MKKWRYVLILLGYIPVFAANAVLPLPSHLIDFTSQSGLVLLKKNSNENTLHLLENFTTEQIETYCGVASAVMVLNSIQLTAPDDLQHPPFHSFNQMNFFTDDVIKIVKAEDVAKNGMSLGQLAAAIQAHGARTHVFYAQDLTLVKTRKILMDALAKQKPIIANILRTGLNQVGGGHHSPIAAYDKQSDRFLFLDVARYKYHASWVKTSDLWTAINTMDHGASRGFIIVSVN